MVPKKTLTKKSLPKKRISEEKFSQIEKALNNYDKVLNGLLVCKNIEDVKTYVRGHDADYDKCVEALICSGYTEEEAVEHIDNATNLYFTAWVSEHPSEYNALMNWLKE